MLLWRAGCGRLRRQQGLVPLDGLDRLLADMNLGDWFGGAPGWLRRS